MEPNDSPEIPNRGKTSDFFDLPSGRDKEADRQRHAGEKVGRQGRERKKNRYTDNQT